MSKPKKPKAPKTLLGEMLEDQRKTWDERHGDQPTARPPHPDTMIGRK